MLDGLLGRGFAAKCKSLIKLTKSRIDVIRRKRKATMKFLKKDIADLLANGLDINAYGRADGLRVELTVCSCYDYIEETCDFVLKHLSVIQKQGECPEECREAVSSLMFAAARFSDLPELRDLRQMFHERYGNSLEYFANKEFVEKLSSKPAKMESKVQLMQDIALEFSIRWDSMAFQHRMSNPSVPAQGQNKKLGSYHVADNSRSVHRVQSTPNGDRHKFAYKEGHELPPKYDYSPRHSKDGREPKRTEGGREKTVEKHVPWIQKEDANTRKDRFGSSSHRNGQESPDERTKLQNGRDNAVPITNGQDKEADRLRPYYNNAIPPPYVKPYSKRNEDKYSSNPGSTPSHLGSDGVVKDSSARDRSELGDHSDLERHAGLVRMNGHDHEKDRREDVTGDRDSSRKLKSARRRHSRSRSHHDDVSDPEDIPIPTRKSRSKRRDDPRRGLQVLVGDGFDDEKDEEERVIDRLLMHYSKKPTLELEKLRRKPKSRRSHHKGTTDAAESPWNNSRSRDKPQEETEMTHVLRSSSLPREQSAPPEPVKVYARAASFQPDRSSPARHVHPKLPDYDDLAARFASLKGR